MNCFRSQPERVAVRPLRSGVANAVATETTPATTPAMDFILSSVNNRDAIKEKASHKVKLVVEQIGRGQIESFSSSILSGMQLQGTEANLHTHASRRWETIYNSLDVAATSNDAPEIYLGRCVPCPLDGANANPGSPGEARQFVLRFNELKFAVRACVRTAWWHAYQLCRGLKSGDAASPQRRCTPVGQICAF